MIDQSRKCKKIVIIPDSFKGSMSSSEVSKIVSDAFGKHCDCELILIPIADGGEGSTDCILQSTGGDKITVLVNSPEFKMIQASYGIINDTDQSNRTAVLEIAESSGITRQSSYSALNATTYGFGEMIRHALDEKVRDFYICLGGSATTDCGCGMAAALGVKFINQNGSEFIPTGGTLGDVQSIDLSNVDSRIRESHFVVMSDVENPLFGEKGAAYVYAPQKGATPDEVLILDQGLQHISDIIAQATGISCSNIRGAGAAGGAGYGCVAFLNAEIRSGIEAMLQICEFDQKIENCDLIVTGEGKLDSQSLMGKVLSGIKKHAGNIPVLSFCGCCEADKNILKLNGIDVVEIGRDIPLEESIKNGAYYLKEAAERYAEQKLV